MALFGTAYFQLLQKFKQKVCQTVSFCSSLSVQLLFQQAAAVPNRAYV
jgi:hypothetical protein